jgi:hypothetical protein
MFTEGEAGSEAAACSGIVGRCYSDDAHQRDQNLTRRDFDPAPSFILDSGAAGMATGWMTRSTLEDGPSENRRILRGLFALGGDPEYVKTVAGLCAPIQ